MQVHRSIENLPGFKNAVVTIGTFDGVHMGHQQIIRQLKEEATAIDGETVIITFHPHPRVVVTSGKPVHLLNTLDEKISLLADLAVDHLVVVPFDEAFSNQLPEEYVKNFLYDKFHPHTLIIGYDHHFGKNRRGDYHLLEDYGSKLGFAVKEIPEQVINQVTISSTRIREALLHTDLETANKYLGYAYFFEGMVVDGNKLGRTLGYPTANIFIKDEMKLVPANGIYVAETEIVGGEASIGNRQSPPEGVGRAGSIVKDQLVMNKDSSQLTTVSPRRKGMMSIGVRPTVDGKNRTIEVNIFDFEEEIYGRILKIYALQYLRPELKFNTLDELKKQIDKDKEASLEYFAKGM